jgi:hypothetical protein
MESSRRLFTCKQGLLHVRRAFTSVITSRIIYVPFTIATGLVADETMRHGYISIDERGRCRLTHETYLTLQNNECMERVGEFIMVQDPGTYLIPMSLMRNGEAEDLVRSLELLDPEPSPTCIHPSCMQATVTVKDGYPLCENHAALLQSWDDLICGL